jgi:hypothetical protein
MLIKVHLQQGAVDYIWIRWKKCWETGEDCIMRAFDTRKVVLEWQFEE